MSDNQQAPTPESTPTPPVTRTGGELDLPTALATPPDGKKATEPPIRSLEHMLRAVYRDDRKPRWPKASELAAVKGALGLQPATHDELLALAAKDRSLERRFQAVKVDPPISTPIAVGGVRPAASL